jgi:hypothetical protein
MRDRFQLAYVRAHECTEGPSGWHPHLHAVLLTGRALTEVERAGLEDWILLRWQRGMRRPQKETGHVYRLPLEGVGVKLTRSSRDDYIAKLGLADELAHGSAKRGRGAHRTPFQILFDIWSQYGTNERDVALWREFADEMRGARQLTWSRGLRERYALPEQTDLELVDAADEAPAHTIYEFADGEWDECLQHDVGLRIRVLNAAEKHAPHVASERIRRLIDQALGIPAVPF